MSGKRAGDIQRRFSSLDELEAVQADHCNWLQDHPNLVRSATCFHWWPDPLYNDCLPGFGMMCLNLYNRISNIV